MKELMMSIFGKHRKTLLVSLPIVMGGADDNDQRISMLHMADFRLGEWEELCKDYLIAQARGRQFAAQRCDKCGHKTALKLWSEKPLECEAEDARRLSFRCINEWCNETYSSRGLIRQSDEMAILQIIDPAQFSCIPQEPYIPILNGFGDHVQRRERVTLHRENGPLFDAPAEVMDFGMYGGPWIEVAADGHTHRINLGGIAIKRE